MSEPVLLSEQRAGVGMLTINRPKSLNALDLEVIQAITDVLLRWQKDDSVKAVWIEGAGDKAFCAGGDVRAAWYDLRDGGTMPRDIFVHEYRMNALIEGYEKPYIAWLDGITMGGGVGVSIHGSHPIATENTLFAMPETGIGLFPDVGATSFFNKIDGPMARYLGLTGARLKAADLISSGLMKYHVQSENRERLLSALLEVSAQNVVTKDMVSSLVNEFCRKPKMGSDLPNKEILSAFGTNDLSTIRDALSNLGTYGQGILENIEKNSPFSLHLFLYLLAENRGKSFQDCMALEFRASQAAMKYPDFFEGIRALLIDKDKTPKWSGSLDGFTLQMIADMVVQPEGGDLIFIDD